MSERPTVVPVVPPAGPAAGGIREARALFVRGNQAAALQLACSVLKKDPRCADAYVLLAELSLPKAGGGPVAEKLARQALALQSNDIGAQRVLASALLAQDRLPEANAWLDRVLKARPGDLAATLALAGIREATKRFPVAEALLRAAASQHPQVPTAAQALGNFLKRHGQVREALVWHRRAVGAGPVPVPSAGAKRRIAFLVQYPQGWTSLKSVWEAFAADASCTVTVIACPFQHSTSVPEAIYGHLERENVPFVKWNEFSWTPDFADVLFVQLPYDNTRPRQLAVVELLRLVPRIAYVPYGLEVGGGAMNASFQFNLPLQQLAWAVFARSPRHRAMYARHCGVGDAHVFVTGHPRMDALRQLPELPPDGEFEGLARGRKIVFWNPQFDVRADGTGFSTFLLWQEFLLAEFARRQDLAFVIRPHPLFFGTLEDRRIWTPAQVADFLQRVAQAGNVVIDRRTTYLPVFAASSAMISDASTFLLEYLATGKPQLYLPNPQGPGLNDDGEFVRTQTATATTREEIGRFLDELATNAEVSRSRRLEAFAQVMHLPPQGVGQAIRQHVLERLAAESAGAGQTALDRQLAS